MANEKRLIVTRPDDCIQKTKRKTNFARIIVSGTAEKPYYDIMWFDYMDGQYHIGYGSYNLNFVFQWLSDCFEVEDTPTVDAAPVVHGRWGPELMPTGVEYSGYQEMTVQALSCSVCGKCIDVSEGYFSYCPNCGAKMDGDGNG